MQYKKHFLIFFLVFCSTNIYSQNYPWERPLRIAWSNDGIYFNTSTIFQDSSGVPSVIRWNGDTLISAFQWFRAPVNSLTWDRVAVKLSYDNGLSWTNPVPIVVNGIPPNYQRPFDPTLIEVNDSIRIYFSSSATMPLGGLDSTVNTYSAISADGINYVFEPGPRVDEINNRVIDPAVIYFNNSWHYISPVGSPQQGAYHYISPDGSAFTAVPLIPSDSVHNWTGNYMFESTNELRFYGSSPLYIWFNVTPNGGMWNGYINTNVQGGDPAALKVASNNYMMIFVGAPYVTTLNELSENNFSVAPNPAADHIIISSLQNSNYRIIIYSINGDMIFSENNSGSYIDLSCLVNGFYLMKIICDDGRSYTHKLVKE